MPLMTPTGMGYIDPAARRREQGGHAVRVLRARGKVRRVWLPRTACAAVLVMADVVAFLAAIGLATILAQQAGSWSDAPAASLAMLMPGTLPTGGVLLAAVMLSFGHHGHYWRRIPFWSELRDVVVASTIALLCAGFFKYSLQLHDSRLFLGLSWILFPVSVMAVRAIARRTLSILGLWQLPVVLVGNGEMVLQAQAALLSEPRLGYRVVSVVEPAVLGLTDTNLNLRDAGVRDTAARWSRVVARHRAQLLVLAQDPTDPATCVLTESLVRARVPFAVMPRLDGLPVLGFEQTCFFSHDTVMFLYRNNLAQPMARLTKLAFDLSVAALLLTLAAPVLLAIALAVKLDGGPALFSHRRVGANGREFPCFKFRSMVIDSDAVLRRVLDSDPEAAAEWADTRKLRNDPRVTWIGRLLRATSLDELPQLLNVLRLEMSLVGPRPIVRSEVARYADDISYYYETRPGLTGLWQVSGRSDTSYAQRVRLDTWYVKNWTIWHDLAILVKTIPAVLKRQGAV